MVVIVLTMVVAVGPVVLMVEMKVLCLTGVLRSSSMMARAAADLNTGLNIAWRVIIIIIGITTIIIIIIIIIITPVAHHNHHHKVIANLAGGLTV